MSRALDMYYTVFRFITMFARLLKCSILYRYIDFDVGFGLILKHIVFIVL